MTTLLLGFVFLLTAYLKAVRPDDTIASLSALFGDRGDFAQLSLYALVLGEMTLAAALLANLSPRRTLRVAIGVLAVFTMWIVYLLSIGWTKGCGCGSWTPSLDPAVALWLSLARNAALLGTAGAGLFASRRFEDRRETPINAQSTAATDRDSSIHAQTQASTFDA